MTPRLHPSLQPLSSGSWQEATAGEPHRVLWLLNHSSLRRFELPQLAREGIVEAFTPKSFPYDEGNLSASVDHTTDRTLTLPADELEVLNAQDWYRQPSVGAWEIANRRFSLLFCAFFPEQLSAALRHFRGRIVLRAFGLSATASYTALISECLRPPDTKRLWERARRGDFHFATAYSNLSRIECDELKRAECLLPIGVAPAAPSTADGWTGDRAEILFVCPRIGTSPYFAKVYADFIARFGDLPYRIGGAQPLPVDDPRVLGFIPREAHEENLRRCRVMFYHSTEPRHLHYHPFEAVQAGMPLVFMAGGMLDHLGGATLPGRCRSPQQARRLIRRLLDGDRELAERLRSSQGRLLGQVTPEACAPHWHDAMRRLLAPPAGPVTAPVRRRIAVILPVSYRGGTLRGARLLAQALQIGSRLAGEPADIVFGHPEDPETYGGRHAPAPLDGIPIVPFRWRQLTAGQARSMMRFTGQRWEPSASTYLAPDDTLSACDAWVVVSDRLPFPLVPLKPVILMVFDYLQRYVDILGHGADLPFLQAARCAERVLVTTRFTEQDALQYAGVSRDRLVKVPMLAPEFPLRVRPAGTPERRSYFLWTTNAAPHKNHHNAIEALAIYYHQSGGGLDCLVTGVDTGRIPDGQAEHLAGVRDMLQQHEVLRRRIRWLGDLSDAVYQEVLADASFLWHPGRIDNGTFSVIEAAHAGVPALSSDYPAMREIAEQFGLELAWMDPLDPGQIARQLRAMEDGASARRALLPSPERLASQRVERLAGAYWEAVRPCL